MITQEQRDLNNKIQNADTWLFAAINALQEIEEAKGTLYRRDLSFKNNLEHATQRAKDALEATQVMIEINKQAV